MGAKVTGLPDLQAALKDVPAKLRGRPLRNALAAGGRVVRNAARAAAPVLKGAAKYRKPGTLRAAINVRTSKLAKRAGDVGVFVNVRPAKKGQRGAKSPSDPYYWQWQNFGWTPATGPRRGTGAKAAAAGRRKARRAAIAPAIPGTRFLEAGSRKLPDALQAFTKAIGPQITKLNQRKADKA